jgi:thioesterase-3
VTVTTEIKVRGFHLDLYGHVNNARYLEFCEDARWAWADENLDMAAWEERGLAFLIVRIAVNYRRPATLGDLLTVSCHLAHLGGRSGLIKQLIHNRSAEQLVADAEVTFVIVDTATERTVALEGPLRREFERILAAQEA